MKILSQRFLADRTNGRAYATVLRPSVVVCRLWRYVLWLNGASYSKSYYWEPIGSRIWEIDWYQNEW